MQYKKWDYMSCVHVYVPLYRAALFFDNPYLNDAGIFAQTLEDLLVNREVASYSFATMM